MSSEVAALLFQAHANYGTRSKDFATDLEKLTDAIIFLTQNKRGIKEQRTKTLFQQKPDKILMVKTFVYPRKL